MQLWSIKSCFLLFILFFCFQTESVFGQLNENDLLLIEQQDFHDHLFDKHEVRYLFADSDSKFVKYNPLSLIFGSLMYFYQKAVSPQFAAGCLYEISCSNYSKKLISEYGLFKGVFTSADRLSRCTRLSTLDTHELKINQETGKVKEDVDVYKISK